MRLTTKGNLDKGVTSEGKVDWSFPRLSNALCSWWSSGEFLSQQFPTLRHEGLLSNLYAYPSLIFLKEISLVSVNEKTRVRCSSFSLFPPPPPSSHLQSIVWFASASGRSQHPLWLSSSDRPDVHRFVTYREGGMRRSLLVICCCEMLVCAHSVKSSVSLVSPSCISVKLSCLRRYLDNSNMIRNRKTKQSIRSKWIETRPEKY